MSSIKALRDRWKGPEGSERWRRVCELLMQGAARRDYENLVVGLAYSDEVPGFVDLRGIPYSGAIPTDPCHRFDFSYATKPKEFEDSELNLNVSDYAGSRFRGIKFGISVLGGKVTDCDFSDSRIKRTDFAFSGDLSGVRFDCASLSWSTFRDQRVIGCSFGGSTLSDCGFAGVALVDCCFHGARLTRCRFVDCQFVGSTSFDGAVLQNVKIPEGVGACTSPQEEDPLARVTIQTALEIAERDNTLRCFVPLLRESLLAMDGLANRMESLEAGLSAQDKGRLDLLIETATEVALSRLGG